MYDKIGEEMEDAKVAVRLAEPIWVDRDGNVCDEKDAFGCKVTHQIIHPEYVIVFDELGGNTSQKGDGNVGGQLMLCERGKTPQLKISTRDKHYTMMGLTSINGKPVMCVVIFAGKRPNALCETGLDLHAPTVGEPSDPDFLEKTRVQGNGSQADLHVNT